MKKKEEEAIAFLKDVNEHIKKAEPFQLEYKEGWYKKILIILAEKDFNNFDIILNLIEKIKELEKGNRSLMDSRKKWKNRYYKQKHEIKELKEQNTQLSNYLNDSYYVSADKIREVLKDLDEFDTTFFNASTLKEAIKNSLNNLLEENK